LRHAKYMLQIDFEAYYDTIRLPEDVRNNFVFRKGSQFFRLCTLPTGARWSVAVGQVITWMIVDIDTPVIVSTMIDNIPLARVYGQYTLTNLPTSANSHGKQSHPTCELTTYGAFTDSRQCPRLF